MGKLEQFNPPRDSKGRFIAQDKEFAAIEAVEEALGNLHWRERNRVLFMVGCRMKIDWIVNRWDWSANGQLRECMMGPRGS